MDSAQHSDLRDGASSGPRVRLAEVVASLSLATDLAGGLRNVSCVSAAYTQYTHETRETQETGSLGDQIRDQSCQWGGATPKSPCGCR